MTDPMSMAGKKIVITGGGAGIGRSTALLLRDLGAELFLLDMDRAAAESTVMSCGGGAVAKECDVTDMAALELAFDEARDRFGPLHGFVHCAGVPSIVPLRVLRPEQYERVQRVNTEAGFALAKLFSKKRYRDADAVCSIVYLSSVYGLVGSAGNAAYAVSKAGIIGLTKALAIELAPQRIRVNCVAPGFVRTDMADDVEARFDTDHAERVEKLHPLGWGEPIDVANGIAFLLSDAAKWITGTVLSIDGGYTAQ